MSQSPTSLNEGQTGSDRSSAPKSSAPLPTGLERLLTVEIPITIRLGATEKRLQEVIGFEAGTVVELDAALNGPVELLIGGCRLARAELVAIGDAYGVRITEIASPDDRLKSLL